MKSLLSGNIETKLATQPQTQGWFIGHFIDEAFFHSEDFEVRWHHQTKGEKKAGLKANETTKTFVLLIHGKFKVLFEDGSESVLKKLGDFTQYDASEAGHFGIALEDTLLLVIRWPSKRNS